MRDLERVLDRAVDTRVGRCVERDIQLKVEAQLFRLGLDCRKVLIGKVVIQVDQRHVDDLDAFLNTHVHQLIEVDDLLKLVGSPLALEAPAFAQAAQVQGVGVHAEFEFAVRIFSSDHCFSLLVLFRRIAFFFPCQLVSNALLEAGALPVRLGGHARDIVKRTGKGGIAAVSNHYRNLHYAEVCAHKQLLRLVDADAAQVKAW